MFPSDATADNVDRTKDWNPVEAVKAVLLSCFFKILLYQLDALPSETSRLTFSPR